MLSRIFILSAFLICTIKTISGQSQIPRKGETFSPWSEGMLDLHHINIGRGNVAYYVFPDGTTLLFDAGEQEASSTQPRRRSSIHPNDSRRAYEWIAHYINQVTPRGRNSVINYAILSHYHDDHMGAWYETAPKSSKGEYKLTGITGVAELIPVEVLLDRGYAFPYDFKSKELEDSMKKNPVTYRYWMQMDNYFSFVNQRAKDKLITTTLKAGSITQLRLQYNAAAYPDFFVRGIKSNERIWTGKDSSIFNQFPLFRHGDRSTFPTENACSQVITINYGNFRYYTGGDIPGNIQYGQSTWMDIETPVSKAVGAVDVATMNHHGNRDALNENFVKTLRPRVWVEQVWSADHPGHEVLIRATTPYLYPGPRDIFSTNMLQANRDVIGSLVDRAYKSTQGHVLVRVMPGGSSYYVIILDDSVENLVVKDVFGPYEVNKK